METMISSSLERRIAAAAAAALPPEPNCYNYDASISATARQDDTNKCIRRVEETKTCCTALEQDAGEGNTLKEDHGTNRDEQSKHSHELILQTTNTGLDSSSMASCRTGLFILDSGATSHMVGDVSLFSSSSFTTAATTPAGCAATYQAHDGIALTVAGIGTVSCDNFHIPDVLCVPDLRLRTVLNRVSVQQLAECDYLVVFGGGQCSVKDQSSGQIFGKGRLHDDDGLYHLDFLKIPPDIITGTKGNTDRP